MIRAIVVGACVVTVLVGCAPGFGTNYRFPSEVTADAAVRASFQGAASEEDADSLALGRYVLGPVTDERGSAPLVVVDGREVPATGDLSEVVAGSFRTFAEGSGLLQCSEGDSCPIVRLAVVEWGAEVTPAFPLSTIAGRARVVASVVSAKNEPLYERQYVGSSGVRHPAPGESEVDDALHLALGHALNGAIRDSALRARLNN